MRAERLSANVVIMLGDCLQVLPSIGKDVALVTDQPYGMNYKINARSWNNEGLDGLKPFKMKKRGAIAGDNKPFDPAPL